MRYFFILCEWFFDWHLIFPFYTNFHWKITFLNLLFQQCIHFQTYIIARYLFKKYGIPITIFDSRNDFKLHNLKMKGKIRYQSEFLTLIEDFVKLIIKSAIISLLSEYLPKASTFVCSWSVSWYSDPQYLNVESQNTIF